MQTTGFTRRIGDLGRIAIPKEIRKALQLEENDTMKFFIDIEKKQIIIQPYRETVEKTENHTMSNADKQREKWKQAEKEFYHKIENRKEKIRELANEALDRNDGALSKLDDCIIPTANGEEKATIIHKHKADYSVDPFEKRDIVKMDKKHLRIVRLTKGEHKELKGYCHGIFQYGNLEFGMEAFAVIELSDGQLIREPIEYIKFED